MNINAVVVSQLKKRRAAMLERHAKELAPIEAALAAFGGSVGGSVVGGVTEVASTRKRKKRKLSPEQIAKMVAGRAAKRAEKAANGQTEAPATQVRESRPRLPTGPPKGASLAEAAS